MATRAASPRAVRVLLVVVGSAVVLVLLAASLHTHMALRRIDRAAVDLANNDVPSVHHLTRARTALRSYSLEVDSYINEGDPIKSAHLDAMWQARQQLVAEVAAYDALPSYGDEKEIRSRFDGALANADAQVARIEEAVRAGNRRLADTMFDEQARLALSGVDEVLVALATANVEQVRAAAENIAAAEERSTVYGFMLDGVSVVLAIAAGSFAWRTAQANRALAEQRHELERRSEELDRFAGRVAHDVLSPLSSVSIALGMALKRLGPDAEASGLLSRAHASLMRIEPLVHGLLDFARAAARPEPGVRTDVRTALDEAVSDARVDAEQAGEEVRVEAAPALQVACAPAVLASVLSNLIRNAIKYTRNSAVRQISVRAIGAGEQVRIEVEDTGPGLTPELARAAFEPYVRGPGVAESGIGLGLATVRRLTEAHGGKVGVESGPHKGSCFWVELPRAV